MPSELNTKLNAIKTNKDTYLLPANIKKNVTILGVTGQLDPDLPAQDITVAPTTSQQVLEADPGYKLGTVTVSAVTSNIDQNITSGNIKSGTTILRCNWRLRRYRY